MKIRIKLISSFFLIALIPCVIAMGWGFYVIQSLQQTMDANQYGNALQRVTTDLSAFVQKRVDNYNIQIVQAGVNTISDEQQHFILNEMLNIDSYIVEASIIDTQGQETNKILKKDKTLIHRGDSYSREPLFTVPMSGKNYFGPVATSNNEKLLTLSTPIYNTAKQVVGVLRILMSLSYVDESLVKNGLTNAQMFIVDADNKVIFSPVGFDLAKADQWSVLGNLKDKQNFDTKGLGASPVNGQNYSFLSQKINDLSWRVFVQWPQNKVGSTLNTFILQISLVGGLLLIMIIITTLILSHRFSSPLEKLASDSAVISSGNYKYRIKIPTKDEVEQVGEEINKLAQSLDH